MLQPIILIIFGFILLILGADFLIKGSSNIAYKFHIPEIIVGLTIVAIGTSMPELIITITSGGKGETDLIIGNAIGSNLCNLLFILGLIAMIKPIELDKEVQKIHLPVALISTLTILAMGLGLLGSQKSVISRIDGIILIILYLIYFMYPIIIEIKDILKTKEENRKNHQKNKNVFLSIIFVVIGIILLKFGGDLVVDEATEIATIFGISKRVIGLTIVAIGTALPELVTSIIAVINSDGELAVGNLFGSCILNSFLILGVGAVITPLSFTNEFIENLILLALSILFISVSCLWGRKNTITKSKASILLIAFTIYIIKLFI